MKVTPLEIRQKAFEKVFRGYDKDEVQAYLISLSQEWEKLIDKNKDLELRLDTANRELGKLHEIESSLFKTLKTAEETSNSIIEQASQKAELQIKESNINSEKLLNETHDEAKFILDAAHEKSDEIIGNSEKEAKNIMDNMLEVVKELEFHFHEINTARDSVIEELQHLNKDILSKVEKASRIKNDKKVKLNDILSMAKKQSRSVYGMESSVSNTKANYPPKEEVSTQKLEENTPVVSKPEGEGLRASIPDTAEKADALKLINALAENKSETSQVPEKKIEEPKDGKEESFFDNL